MDEAAIQRYEALVAEFGNQDEDDDRCEMLDQAVKDADDAYAQSEKTPKDRKLLATKLRLLFVARQQSGCGRPHILNA